MEKGAAPFTPRARVMMLLGEQLITDEVAAISELVKNSYDADAKLVTIELLNVSDQEQGTVIITDNGHGMTKDTVLSSWMEIGTPSKLKKGDDGVRRSEKLHRAYLGEKGLGRLSVHKIGSRTELITRRTGSPTETKLTIDWSAFEDTAKYLKDVHVEWEMDEARFFTKTNGKDEEQGTRLVLTKLHRAWDAEMMKKIKYFVWTMTSPLTKLPEFNVELKIVDPKDPVVNFQSTKELLKTAHYEFKATIGADGKADLTYESKLPLYPHYSRKKTFDGKRDLRQPNEFEESRLPQCGHFTVKVFCWDLTKEDKEATFADRPIYEDFIKPQTGVRLFRDGFRVLPYGNEDNDWLNMDKKRIERFAENVSRNQIIGIIEINSKDNPFLIDKSDREGLIENRAFLDFRSLVLSALQEFENERMVDRDKIKEENRNRKTRKEAARLAVKTVELRRLMKEHKVPPVVVKEVDNIVRDSQKLVDKAIEEAEEPLLVAASIGLTYMIPTHETRRNVTEAAKLLRRVRERSKSAFSEELEAALQYLIDTEFLVAGIGKLAQKSDDVEFELRKPIEAVGKLLKNKLERNGIKFSTDYRDNITIVGSERLITIMLLNMVDNSIFWLQGKSKEDRKIMIITARMSHEDLLVVSDTGPGIQDNIDIITRPFFTRKLKGMGLGLYICDRIAHAHKARLSILDQNDLPGLHPGANLAIRFLRDVK